MRSKIVQRADSSRSFGWKFRNGSPARDSQTVDASLAAKLGLSGTVNDDGTVTTKARDAKPRTLVLTNAMQLTASAPTGEIPAGGVAVSDRYFRGTLLAGLPTVAALFPVDGTKASAKVRASVDPKESETFYDRLRALEAFDDIDDTATGEASI